MSHLEESADGAYALIPGSDAFAIGVRSRPGWAISDMRLRHPVRLRDAVRRLVGVIDDRGARPSAIVGLELRSPHALDAERFAAFNGDYRELLADVGITEGTVNTVTRTNAVPVDESIDEVVVIAAQVIHPAAGHAGGDYVLSGVSELVADGSVIAADDASASGLAAKVSYVLGVIDERRERLGAGHANTVNAYCGSDIGLWGPQVARGIRSHVGTSLRHWRCIPPLVGLAFELDLRRISAWELVDA